MDIPQGSDQVIRQTVEERLRKASGGSRALDAGAGSGKRKVRAGWKHGKLVRVLINCEPRIANKYWKAYCEVVAARLIDRPVWEHDAGDFPYLDDALRTIIQSHPRGPSTSEEWHCVAGWQLELEKFDAAAEPKPKVSFPSDGGAYFADQTESPPRELVEAIYKMRIQPGQLIDTAVSFCQEAASYHKYTFTERARKGGKEKNSPSQEEAPRSSRRKPSDKVIRLVLEKVVSIKCLPADSVKASAKELGVGHSTMRNCLQFLVTEGLLKALKYSDMKGKLYTITAAGRKWLKGKP